MRYSRETTDLLERDQAVDDILPGLADSWVRSALFGLVAVDPDGLPRLLKQILTPAGVLGFGPQLVGNPMNTLNQSSFAADC